MPQRSEVSIARLRAAVEARIAETSGRRTAGEIGISPQGLTKFLRGATPHPSTRVKLESWYLQHSYSADVQLADAVSMLARFLPPEARQNAAEEIIACIASLCHRHGIPLPPELERLRQGLGINWGGPDARQN